MIVQAPPYDLVALFADLDMQKFFEMLIERGQQPARRCIRTIRWRSLRDPRRDTVWRKPDQVLAPFLRTEARFLIIWDHHGSGYENIAARTIEEQTVQRLAKAGLATDRILAVAVEPELEAFFCSVWPRVKKIISSERGVPPPGDDLVAQAARRSGLRERPPRGSEVALRDHPKEMFEGLLRCLRLRRAAPLYEKIGSEISLPGVKQDRTALRIAETMRHWFSWRPEEGIASRK